MCACLNRLGISQHTWSNSCDAPCSRWCSRVRKNLRNKSLRKAIRACAWRLQHYWPCDATRASNINVGIKTSFAKGHCARCFHSLVVDFCVTIHQASSKSHFFAYSSLRIPSCCLRIVLSCYWRMLLSATNLVYSFIVVFFSGCDDCLCSEVLMNCKKKCIFIDAT